MSDHLNYEFIVTKLDKLIESLLGADATTAERRKCEQEALHILRHHRNISPNSHEVRRSVDNLAERFFCENMPAEANTLRELAQIIAESPLWKDHYEVDIQYSVLEFLFCMVYAPTQNVQKNRQKMSQRLMEINDAIKIHKEMRSNSAAGDMELIALLKEDFINVPSSDDGDDSSLSDWSAASDSEQSSLPNDKVESKTSMREKDMAVVYANARDYPSGVGTYMPEDSEKGKELQLFKINTPKLLLIGEHKKRMNLCTLPVLKPLHPLPPFSLHKKCDFDPDELPLKIHTHWWKEDININAQLTNDNPQSNFAIAYVQHQNRNLRPMLREPIPNTMTEYSLLREVIFAFFKPTDCFFFKLSQNPQRITVRENVTVCSISVGTFRDMIEMELLPAMNAMMELRKTINKYVLNETFMPVATLTCFMTAVRDLLQPIDKRLIAFEHRLIENAATETPPKPESRTTLITFVRQMNEEFKLLKFLQSLVAKVIIKAPPYVSSVYALSRLRSQIIFNTPNQKIVMALLLAAIRRYCCIIDNWWQGDGFHDRFDEYIMEISAENSYELKLRERLPLEVDFKDQEVIDTLNNCPLYKLLVDHARKAYQVQRLLECAGTLFDLVSVSRHRRPLHAELSEEIFKDLCSSESESPEITENSDSQLPYPHPIERMVNLEIFSILTNRLSKMTTSTLATDSSPVLRTLNRLKSCMTLQLPYVLPSVLAKILERRCEVANVYIMKWYREKLMLEDHLRFLSRILLFEADFALYPFYTNLFRQIELGNEWAHQAHLTWELFDALDRYYPGWVTQMHVQFVSKVSSQSNKVYEALDNIKLVYDMSSPLQCIISVKHMAEYNAIWRFVLKIKWASWKLENLQFLRHKSRDGAPLDLLGLTVRRLEIIRFWLLYVISNVHSHLCSNVLPGMGNQLLKQLKGCTELQELIELHDNYLKQLMMHCLLGDLFVDFHTTLEQLFHLVVVIDMEWNSCYRYLNESHALSPDNSSDENNDTGGHIADNSTNSDLDLLEAVEYLALNQVDEIESTYIRCHQMMAEILRNLVNDHEFCFLDSLKVAICSSEPC